VTQVQELFRLAIDTGDADAMRNALEQLFGVDADGVSAADEYALRHEDYVMEMPQSGERISSRDLMRAMQESFPGPPPSITIRRVSGAGRSWAIEGTNDYGDGELWSVVLLLEFSSDGRMLRDTRYYAKAFPAPEWRAKFTDPKPAAG
jgi:hypothetical protein